jgi:ribosome biogenesis protein NSA1
MIFPIDWLCFNFKENMSTLFITGDETGLLKAVQYNQSLVYSFGEQDRENSVIGLASAAEQSSIALLRKTGRVEYWKYNLEEDINFEYASSLDLELSSAVDLLHLYDNNMVAHNLLAYSSEGSVSIFKNDPESITEGSTSNLASKYTLPGPISAFAACANGGVIFGGKENDVKFYDINTQQCNWEARNVPHDKLKLRVPVWVTTLDFLAPNDSSSHSFDSAKFLSGTAYKQVRLYDTKATDRRPVKSIDIEGDYRVSVVKSSSDGNGFYAADTAGNLYYYDLRTYRRLNTLKCFQGSIRSLTMGKPDPSKSSKFSSKSSSSSSPVLAGVALDRTIRFYDTNTKKLLSKIYLKNRLNRCLALENLSLPMKKTAMAKDGRNKNGDDESEGEANDDDEEEEEEMDEDELEEDHDLLEGIQMNGNDDDDEDNDFRIDEEVSEGEEEDSEDEEEEEEKPRQKKKPIHSNKNKNNQKRRRLN